MGGCSRWRAVVRAEARQVNGIHLNSIPTPAHCCGQQGGAKGDGQPAGVDERR